MSEAEWRAFVLERPRTAKVATIRADGRPHIAPVWIDVDGATIVFTTGERSTKARNLARDPRVSLCVDDEQPPFAFVVIEGTVELSDDLTELRRCATSIGGRYMGADRAAEFGARNGVAGELLVRVRPTRVIAESGITD